MPIPTQTDMFSIVLKLMQDGQERSNYKVRDDVVTLLGLTKEDLAEKTPAGNPVIQSRTGWSLSYLNRAKLLDRVSRGVYQVNDEGRRVHGLGLSESDFYQELRRLIDERDPWNVGADKGGKGASVPDGKPPVTTDANVKSPQEQIGDLAEEMNETLGNELLALIMEKDSDFFERVVVDLMEVMGYGKGRVTAHSNDGGIDGIVSTDELGFRPIYTQAKRYQADHKIGRPVVQSFVGALNGARNGVFITTSSFTQEAMDYAQSYPNATLSLIDGRKLANLMIKYNLGVATESVVEIKRVDSDYFEGD